jgi:ferredoxin
VLFYKEDIVILYFSGTGNSRYAAEIAGNIIKEQPVSINEILRKNKFEPIQSDTPLVFVCPVYSWRIPRVVEAFIEKTDFSGNSNAYFIITCGTDIGNAIYYVEKLCKRKALNFMGGTGVKMPENYIVMFKAPEQDEVENILETAAEEIRSIAGIIKEQRPLPERHVGILDIIKSFAVTPVFYCLFIRAKGFFSTESCTGCGKCAASCPLNNITMQNSAPAWGGNCTHCMSCINICPEKTIEYKKNTKGKTRYYLHRKDG